MKGNATLVLKFLWPKGGDVGFLKGFPEVPRGNMPVVEELSRYSQLSATSHTPQERGRANRSSASCYFALMAHAKCWPSLGPT
jgi:hypothetical protein